MGPNGPFLPQIHAILTGSRAVLLYICSKNSLFAAPNLPGGRGGARIMDLDQYLEKMNTNTNVI